MKSRRQKLQIRPFVNAPRQRKTIRPDLIEYTHEKEKPSRARASRQLDIYSARAATAQFSLYTAARAIRLPIRAIYLLLPSQHIQHACTRVYNKKVGFFSRALHNNSRYSIVIAEFSLPANKKRSRYTNYARDDDVFSRRAREPVSSENGHAHCAVRRDPAFRGEYERAG